MRMRQETPPEEQWMNLRKKITIFTGNALQLIDLSDRELAELAAKNMAFETPATKKRRAELMRVLNEVAVIKHTYSELIYEEHLLEKIKDRELRDINSSYTSAFDKWLQIELALKKLTDVRRKILYLSQLKEQLEDAIKKIDTTIKELEQIKIKLHEQRDILSQQLKALEALRAKSNDEFYNHMKGVCDELKAGHFLSDYQGVVHLEPLGGDLLEIARLIKDNKIFINEIKEKIKKAFLHNIIDPEKFNGQAGRKVTP